MPPNRRIKIWTALSAVMLVAIVAATPAQADMGEHYPLGVEGIKAATLPPPGVYFRNYVLYYTSESNKNANGNDDGSGLDLDVVANASRFVWISKYKILGGYFGMDLIVPVFHVDFDADTLGPPGGVHNTEAGLGDLYLEPITISWHGDRWDAAVGAGIWAPTGAFTPAKPASPGKGYWSPMFTFGATVYLDDEKTWSVSALGRYELHTEQSHTNITRGDDLHFEWGVGKTIVKGLDVGVAGFCHWQITEDSGPGTDNLKDQVFAAGPEVSGMIKKLPLINRPAFISVRALWEFGAKDRPEGFRSVLTFTIPF